MDTIYIMRNFVAAIIGKALYDWQFPERRDEIRAFFKSVYGQELCDVINLPAVYILRRLEEGKINLKYLETEDQND